MTKSKLKITIAIVLAIMAVASCVLGAINLPKREGEEGQEIISDMRIESLINATTGDGLISTYVELAKEEARIKAKENKAKMSEQRKMIADAEKATIEKYEGIDTDNSGINREELAVPVKVFAEKLMAFVEEEALARSIYYDAHYEEAEAKAEAEKSTVIS